MKWLKNHWLKPNSILSFVDSFYCSKLIRFWILDDLDDLPNFDFWEPDLISIFQELREEQSFVVVSAFRQRNQMQTT